MAQRKPFHLMRDLAHRLTVGGGALGLTLLFFMVLPLMQAISKPPSTDTLIHAEVNTGQIEAPPEPPKQEEVKPPEKEPEPPKLTEEAQPLDLAQLDLALNVGTGTGGFFSADLSFAKLNTATSTAADVDALFNISELDQRPRAISQNSPVMNAEMRRKAPATVYIIFIVDQNGRVVDPIVQQSSDKVFEQAALAAVKQWKFEPGKRNGQPVRFRMRVPITFPKG